LCSSYHWASREPNEPSVADKLFEWLAELSCLDQFCQNHPLEGVGEVLGLQTFDFLKIETRQRA
jgi:hypothetical protein